ncbi:hypothetical protein [Streptomyces sp. 8K308]|uniref:TetR/AcrR family transcriptional regulator n=1 Tax=Streptomyces sp. 8K308 TaxID=2530388 RepID=UPI001FB6C0CC|nr:hypothetical protein [Streptomyces sp. 8K308]
MRAAPRLGGPFVVRDALPAAITDVLIDFHSILVKSTGNRFPRGDRGVDGARTRPAVRRVRLGARRSEPDSPMAVLLRTSMTSEEAADLLRGHVTRRAVGPLAERIQAPDARLRAALSGAMMMGVASQRYLLRMPDLEAADLEDILRIIRPVLRALLAPEESPKVTEGGPAEVSKRRLKDSVGRT